jgi:hypothetical protein
MSYVAAKKRAKQYTKVDENRHVVLAVLAAFADVFDVGRFDKDVDPGEVREFSTTERASASTHISLPGHIDPAEGLCLCTCVLVPTPF